MCLVGTVQRDGNIPICARTPANLHHLPTHRRQIRHELEGIAFDKQFVLKLFRSAHNLGERVGLLRRGDDEASWLDDSRFGAGDRRNGVPEEFGVVDADGGEHCDVRVSDIRRIPLAAHSHLENGNVDRCFGERGESEDGDRFKKRQGHFARGDEFAVHQLDVGLDVPPVLEKLFVTDGFAVDHDAFVHETQVRAGHQPRSEPVGTAQRFDHPRRRGLSVRPRDVNHGIHLLRVSQILDHFACGVKARLWRPFADSRDQRLKNLSDFGAEISHAFSSPTRIRAPSPTSTVPDEPSRNSSSSASVSPAIKS